MLRDLSIIENLDRWDWDDATWTDEQPRGSRLLATVHVGGVAFHAEAIEVRWETVEDKDGWENRTQVAAGDKALQEHYDKLYAAIDGADPLQTVTIGGRTYSLFIYPHGA